MEVCARQRHEQTKTIWVRREQIRVESRGLIQEELVGWLNNNTPTNETYTMAQDEGDPRQQLLERDSRRQRHSLL